MDALGLILLFPLLGAIINGFFGKKLPDKIVSLIGCSSIGLSFIVVLLNFFQLLTFPEDSRQITHSIFTWITSGSFNVTFSLLFDPLSAIMALIVSGVSFLIHIYSIGYMHGDKGYARYFTYLNLFVFMMLILVLGDSYLLMFIGWEGVGLCSYLLIGFWYEDGEKASAGKKAFIVNRIGDFGFLLAMFLMYQVFNSLNYSEVFQQAEGWSVNDTSITVITLLLFLGAVGKSAQIPLFVWLPDAMAGPTPVSALIHAATMVTAGVYMIARSSILYALSPASMTVVAVVGTLTAVLAATIAIAQTDIKKVLAYSTISQLGYMFMAVGVGAFGAGIFHLMTHAFFKALLFMGAGSVIHSLSGEQDMRNMGGLKSATPTTFWCMMIAALAISGVPLLSGFFSKDEILWLAFSNPRGSALYWVMGVVAAGITAFYMFRLMFLTFYGKTRVNRETALHLHESPGVMTTPLIILAVLSVVGGYVGVPAILKGSNHFEHFLEPVFAGSQSIISRGGTETANHAAEYLLMLVAIVIAASGLYLAYRWYIQKPDVPEKIADKAGKIYTTVLNKYYIDEIYEVVIVNPFLKFSDFCWKIFDVKGIDGIVNGTAALFRGIAQVLRKIQSGYAQEYIAVFILGSIFIFGYILFG
ncbi:NADH-quinone oxidoreductase subunit L [candidate division KSB1 bacterium]|nr:NADH-quinone oxidoreductase subunit L [candidate division KSB1 bacterium]